MIDTAGIRDTKDKVEAIGVEKSLKMIEESDLILFILNNNEEITDETIEILNKLKGKNYILIINKTDLPSKIDMSKIPVDKESIVNMSIINNQGIEELKNKIKEIFNISQIETKDPTYLSNSRSIAILTTCLNRIEDVEKGLKENKPIDMIELDIKAIWEELGKINGSTYEEELLDEMFSRFCLGK
jgi:tRNA modification GTPase